MTVYILGKSCPELITGADDFRFGINDTGAILFALFDKPTEHEISQYRPNVPFQAQICMLGGIIFMLFKFGDLPWFNAPYHGSLSKTLTIEPNMLIGSDDGLPLSIIMADASNGVVKELRIIKLSNEFSRALLEKVKIQIETPLSLQECDDVVDSIYAKYTTRDLLKFCTSRFKTK